MRGYSSLQCLILGDYTPTSCTKLLSLLYNSIKKCVNSVDIGIKQEVILEKIGLIFHSIYTAQLLFLFYRLLVFYFLNTLGNMLGGCSTTALLVVRGGISQTTLEGHGD